MSHQVQAVTGDSSAVEIYCTYLGVNRSAPDPYKVAVGAIVLRSTISRYVANPKARLFERLLFKAVGAFPDGKNMVEKAAALARRAQIEQASGNLPPCLLGFMEKIQQYQIENMSEGDFGRFCEELHIIIEAVRITLPFPLLPNTVKTIEHVLKAAAPVLVERTRATRKKVIRVSKVLTENSNPPFGTDVSEDHSNRAEDTTDTDTHLTVTESEPGADSDTETDSVSESEAESDSDQENDFRMDIDNPANIIPRVGCRKISAAEAEHLWEHVEDDDEGYLGSSEDECDTNKEELRFACLWRAQSANNAWQLTGPLERKSRQPTLELSADDHREIAGTLIEIGFNAVIFTDGGHTLAASFGNGSSMAEGSSERCFRFLRKWKGDTTSRLPKPTGKRGFDKELAEEVSGGLLFVGNLSASSASDACIFAFCTA